MNGPSELQWIIHAIALGAGIASFIVALRVQRHKVDRAELVSLRLELDDCKAAHEDCTERLDHLEQENIRLMRRLLAGPLNPGGPLP